MCQLVIVLVGDFSYDWLKTLNEPISVDRLQVLVLEEAVLEGELLLLALPPPLVVEVDVRALLVLLRDRLRLLVAG